MLYTSSFWRMFMLSRVFAATLLVPALLLPAATRSANPHRAPGPWVIDRSHSSVGFTIRHFVSKVHGNFRDFKGTIAAEPEAWQNGQIEVEIQAASINTNNDTRDKDLRSANFFSVDTFPVVSFRSTRIERSGDDAKIHGDLTIRGVTKAVVLDGHFNGIQAGARADRVGIDATTTINRLDYGVKWNRAAEGGGVMLGDEVKIEINVEAVRQKP